MVEQSSVRLWNLWQFDLEEKAIFYLHFWLCVGQVVYLRERERNQSNRNVFLLVLIAKERKEHNVRQFLWISLVLRSLKKVPCALFSFFSKNRNFPFSMYFHLFLLCSTLPQFLLTSIFFPTYSVSFTFVKQTIMFRDSQGNLF